MHPFDTDAFDHEEAKRQQHKTSQSIWRREMKEEIISAARAIYGLNKSPTCKFDVIISKPENEGLAPEVVNTAAILICYEDPTASNKWTRILHSNPEACTVDALEALLRMLRLTTGKGLGHLPHVAETDHVCEND